MQFEDLLTKAFDAESEDFLDLLKLRNSGFYKQALKKLKSINDPGNGWIQLLQYRLYLEHNKDSIAKRLLQSLIKSDFDDPELLALESACLRFNPRRPEKSIEPFLKALRFEDENDQTRTDLILAISNELEKRRRLFFASELLVYGLSQTEDPRLRARMVELSESVQVDLYYSYYGTSVILGQILLSGTLLCIALYYLCFQYHDYYQVIMAVIASAELLPTHPWKESFTKVIQMLVIFVALLPLLIINIKMLLGKYIHGAYCYTEKYEEFTKTSEFGRICCFRTNDPSREVCLYLDDNDFNYSDFIRHFPLVPNFTYLYAYETLRDAYQIAPLFGHADGKSFAKDLREKGIRVIPLNMIGVRLAQLGSVIQSLPVPVKLLAFSSLMMLWSFFVAHLSLADQSDLYLYLAPMTILGLWILEPFLSRILLGILRSKPGFLLRIPVLKLGLTLLAASLFYNHYQDYDLSGVWPSLSLAIAFFIFFVSTRYKTWQKQIVAEISNYQAGTQNEVEMMKIPVKGKDLEIFVSSNAIAIPVHYYFIPWYFEVIDRSCPVEIHAVSNATRIKFKNRILTTTLTPKECQELFDRYKILWVQVDSIKNQIQFRTHLVSLCLVSWLVWQSSLGQARVYDGQVTTDALEAKRKDFALKVRQTFELNNKNQWVHRHENVTWTPRLHPKTLDLILVQSEWSDWKGIENVIKADLKEKFNQEFLPRFLNLVGMRDNSIKFLNWWLWKAHQKPDKVKDLQFYREYCRVQGYQFKDKGCSMTFDAKVISDGLVTNPKLRQMILASESLTPLLVFIPAKRQQIYDLAENDPDLMNALVRLMPASLNTVRQTRKVKRWRKKLKLGRLNSIQMSFRKIPAGQFKMGGKVPRRLMEQFQDPQSVSEHSNPMEKMIEANKSELPAHKIRIEESFYMQNFEVTIAQWRSVMNEIPPSRYNLPDCHDCPVVGMTFSDVQQFLSELNEMEGCKASKEEIWSYMRQRKNPEQVKDLKILVRGCYRLPTEAEWEYACKSGRNSLYAHGDKVADLYDYAWVGSGFIAGTFAHMIGLKTPNYWSLYDMSGNVGEFVQNWYTKDYSKLDSNIDPLGPDDGKWKVIRGGSVRTGRFAVRCSSRGSQNFDRADRWNGFRVVRIP